MKKNILFIIFYFFILICKANQDEKVKEIFKNINLYNLDLATQKLYTVENENCKKILKAKINFLKTGNYGLNIQEIPNQYKNYLEKGIYNLFLGDYINSVSTNFINKVFLHYFESYNIGKNNNDIFLKIESLKKILFLFQNNEMNFKLFEKYSKEYSAIAKEPIDVFWAKYYSNFILLYDKYENNVDNNFNVNVYFDLLKYTQNKSILKGKVYQMIEIYYNLTKNLKSSNLYIEKAKIEYSKSKYFYSQKPLYHIESNEAVNYLKSNNYKKSIQIYRKILNSTYISNDKKNLSIVCDGLYKAYSKLAIQDSALYFLNKKTELEQLMKIDENSISIHEIDTKYQTIEKDKKIMNYEENKYWYALAIICVFLLALYSYIRWKKEDFRRKKIALEKQSLEVEHTQTIEELEKTKQLVIEDHIVLKNKAKVYLQELSYIKSEDHYLQLFTSKKKEFVRGKITEIISELPPNFLQTHRSYIVNKNLITSISKNSIILEGKIEIPLSRNFKKNIEL